VRYVALAVLFAVMQAAPPVPRQTANNPAGTDSSPQKQAAPNQTPRQTEAAVANSNSQKESKHNRCLPALKASYLHQAFSPQNLSNWVLAGCAIGAIIVGLITLGTIKRQTSHAETAANAAKAGAEAAKAQIEAIVAENRPWLLLDKIEPPYLIPAEEVSQEERRFAHCRPLIKNHGKTPAKVTTLWTRLKSGENPIVPPYDLVEEIGRAGPIPETYIFPPGDTKAIDTRLQSGFISAQQRDDVLKNKVKFLWFMGFLKYQNTFQVGVTTEYESRFCYLYETRTNSEEPFWTPAGPPEYNKAT